MNVYSLVSSNRVAACIVLVVALCLLTGCRNKDNAVVVRILLPPSASALREAVATLQHSPPTDGSGRKIVPATMETTDDAEFRKFLKDVQVYRPQIVVVPTSDDIPAALKAENTSTTLPCSSVPNACVSVLTPWGRDEERRAARIVQSRIGPEARAGKQSGAVAQH